MQKQQEGVLQALNYESPVFMSSPRRRGSRINAFLLDSRLRGNDKSEFRNSKLQASSRLLSIIQRGRILYFDILVFSIHDVKCQNARRDPMGEVGEVKMRQKSKKRPWREILAIAFMEARQASAQRVRYMQFPETMGDLNGGYVFPPEGETNEQKTQ